MEHGEEEMWFGKVPPERVQQRLEPGKVKMSESGGRRRLSVFRRCCDNAGPQEALSSHSAGLLPPPLVMLGHLRALRPW